MATVAVDQQGRPSTDVRTAIRDLLTASADFQSLDAPARRDIAQGLVKICSTALALAAEADVAATGVRPPLARAQSAGSEFSGVAAQRVAGTTREILNAVSFPRFVTELITGVFKALVDTNQQQMHGYVELIRNVAASTEGFADANVGLAGARQWLAERFPGSFVIEGESDPFAEPGQSLTPEEQAERDAETQLRLRPGAAMPSGAALRVALGLGPQDSVPSGDPENLVAPARVALARNRQQMLATMVMLGMQRIVIESGRLHASMRFHIDTRSAAAEDRGSTFDLRNEAEASGRFGAGPWGVEAKVKNTIGYVSTQRTQTTEEMNTDLDLNSSVELVFKTDYLPLDRLAGREQVDRIKVNTLNPEAEAKAATEARQAREKRISESETKRWQALDKAIATPPSPPSPPRAGERGTAEDAEKARQVAAKKKQPDETRTTMASTPAPREGGRTPTATTTTPPTAAGSTIMSMTLPTTSGGGTTTTIPVTPVTTAGLTVDPGSPARMETVPIRRPDVVFVPTPDEVIEEMLSLAAVKPGEVLYDLGCGDGRIVVTAAKKYGCRAVGFDIDPERVAEARQNVRINHVEDLVRIEQRDIFTVDLSLADVVTVYLLPDLNVRLVPQLDRMKPGARIVSHDFEMSGVIPDRVVQVYLSRQHMYKTVSLWTVPLKKLTIPVRHEWSNSQRLNVA